MKPAGDFLKVLFNLITHPCILSYAEMLAGGSSEKSAKSIPRTPEGKRPATPQTELKASRGKRQKFGSVDSPGAVKSPDQQAGNGHVADFWPLQDLHGEFPDSPTKGVQKPYSNMRGKDKSNHTQEHTKGSADNR